MSLSSGQDIVMAMRRLERTMSEDEIKKRLTKVGMALKPIGLRAAAGTEVGGDLMLTGSRPGEGWKGPGPLQLSFKANGRGLLMHRSGRSAGVWRVAEEGRNQGNATGFSGPGVNRATGETQFRKSSAPKAGTRMVGGIAITVPSGGLLPVTRKVRAFKRKRWNGTTDGFGTWTAAVDAMNAEAPKIVTRITRQATTDAFLNR